MWESTSLHLGGGAGGIPRWLRPSVLPPQNTSEWTVTARRNVTAGGREARSGTSGSSVWEGPLSASTVAPSCRVLTWQKKPRGRSHLLTLFGHTQHALHEGGASWTSPPSCPVSTVHGGVKAQRDFGGTQTFQPQHKGEPRELVTPRPTRLEASSSS